MRPKTKIGIWILMFLIVITLLSISPVPVEATSTGTTVYFNIGDVPQQPGVSKGSAHSRDWSDELEERVEEAVEDECSISSDCSADESCNGWQCKELDCSFGYIKNHACIKYECYDADDCDEYSKCMNHKCIEKTFKLELKGKELIIDQEATFILYEDGKVLSNTRIRINAPAGEVYEGRTDDKGRFIFTPHSEGVYDASALSVGGKTLTYTLEAATKTTPSKELEPTMFEQCCAFGKCSILGRNSIFGICWYWSVLLIVILLPIVIFTAKNLWIKGRNNGKRNKRKEEIFKELNKIKHTKK